ncbi:MAG: zeta toxin family protein [Desulfobacterales bacterium]|nr:zeta toxin family protein [Desulfobacterales bacterium]
MNFRMALRSRTPLTTLTSRQPSAWTNKPSVIMMVGVNGSGKTTTIAKLGQRFHNEGRSLLFGAADTFRAAAVDQLQVWGDRLGVDVIAARLSPIPARWRSAPSRQVRRAVWI